MVIFQIFRKECRSSTISRALGESWGESGKKLGVGENWGKSERLDKVGKKLYDSW